jgi:hypothetical protein
MRAKAFIQQPQGEDGLRDGQREQESVRDQGDRVK